MSSVRGYDNLYSESVNDIALLNYNKGIANRLKLQEQEMQSRLPFKEPQMLSGGVRASNSILAGTSVDGPSTLAVGGRAFRTFTGNEKPSEGGVNRLKKSKRWTAYAKDTIGDAFDIAKMAGMGSGGVNRLKKSKRWTAYAKDTIGDAFNIYDQAKARGGMVYSQDLKNALSETGNYSGGAKPKKARKPSTRFPKGSQEAKDWGAKMKEARMNKNK